MNSKVSEYAIRSLWSSGFVIMDAPLARQLSGDTLWATALNAGQDFAAAHAGMVGFLQGLPRVEVVEIRFEGEGAWKLAGTRSMANLAERIAMVTGLEVAEILPYAVPGAIAVEPQTKPEDQPPAHPCAARAEWFRRRGLRDPNLPAAATGAR